MMATQDVPTKVINNTFIDRVMSDDASMVKSASDAVNDFTRMRVREDGIWRRVLPPLTISNDELDRQVDTDKPVKIVDREPGSPAAITIPFGTLPVNRYIRGDRYRVMMTRLTTPRFTKDVDELRTYEMDIRQVLSDNAIKDMLAEEDGKAIMLVNAMLGGTVGRNNTIAEAGGVALWQGTDKVLHRSSLADARKVMPGTVAHLQPATALTNNITIIDVEKWQRDEVGGDLAEEIVINGFGERTFNGLKWIISIKTDLIPTNTVFFFAEPKFLGKFFTLTDTTMQIDRKAFMIEFYAYSCQGSTIGNICAASRYDFDTDGDSV
jgi:hypothetical protein